MLSNLPARSRLEFLANCEPVEIKLAEVLCEPGDAISHVYFPLNSFISLVTRLDDGARLEVGMIGNEGMLGISLILGVKVSSQHALVQGAGSCLRMSAATFSRYRRKDPALRHGFDRYVYVLMRQLALTAACTHYHVIEERLARWLLLTRDRAHSDRFHLTHEFLAFMLGVRRVGITEAALSLHARELIDYRRGELVILNGVGLEKASCRCYAQAKNMYEQTLGTVQHKTSTKLRL
ncbi:MAG: Crp/Fnr family transcriptional regulator [Steroidobacteraceae bacterium]